MSPHATKEAAMLMWLHSHFAALYAAYHQEMYEYYEAEAYADWYREERRRAALEDD